MSFSRKRKAEELWSSLVSEEESYIKGEKSKALPKTVTAIDIYKLNQQTNQKKKNVSNKNGNKKLDILSSIFGNSQAKEILNISGKEVDDIVTKQQVSDASTSEEIVIARNQAKSEMSSDVKEAIRNAVQSVQKKQRIIETRKFAGQEVRSIILPHTTYPCRVLPIATSSWIQCYDLDVTIRLLSYDSMCF